MLTSPSPPQSILLIDVREPPEIAQGSIPSSVALPLSELKDALRLSPAAFRARYGFEMPEKQKQIIFYCRSGKRSLTACDLAVRAGWQGVRNYDGSWLDWVRREQERAAGGK
ncbi:Rhodanese-like protein [Calocera cornea HHB12733]|uniref:Rhodanese-like protein n=1 Tax=Calocera cornea HHB12733 TaxID=1353952 RepID=A0A165CMS0_9BASI|nr:Rhodanese-like protein [Calocera cornea HHB12733]